MSQSLGVLPSRESLTQPPTTYASYPADSSRRMIRTALSGIFSFLFSSVLIKLFSPTHPFFTNRWHLIRDSQTINWYFICLFLTNRWNFICVFQAISCHFICLFMAIYCYFMPISSNLLFSDISLPVHQFLFDPVVPINTLCPNKPSSWPVFRSRCRCRSEFPVRRACSGKSPVRLL